MGGTLNKMQHNKGYPGYELSTTGINSGERFFIVPLVSLMQSLYSSLPKSSPLPVNINDSTAIKAGY